MTEKITLGRIIVASIPIALYDWFIFSVWQWVVTNNAFFNILPYPMLTLTGIGIIGTTLWIKYVTRSLLDQRKEKTPKNKRSDINDEL